MHTPAPGAGRTNPIEQRRQAALLLGADETVARHFGATGELELDGSPLLLQPMGDDADGPWLASVRAFRPADASEDDWCEALLEANNVCMTGLDAAFGVDDGGDGVLILRIPPHFGDARLLAESVSGMLLLSRSVLHGIWPSTTTPATRSAS